MDDTTKKPDDSEEEKRGYVPITRRNVMKSVGAVGVLGGYAGTAGASVQDCNCSGLGNNADNRCFEPTEDCKICKLDNLAVGNTCSIDGTSITVTRKSDRCISWTDTAGEIEDIALKAGSSSSVPDGPCTYLSDNPSATELCTASDKTISHITVKYNCDGGNGGPTPSGPVLTCDTAKVDVSGLNSGDKVTLEVEFYDCTPTNKTFTADGTGGVRAQIDLTDVGRCYCTPEKMTLYEGEGTNGTVIYTFNSGLASGFCKPTLGATATCEKVTITASGILEADSDTVGCPIDATVKFSDCSSKTAKITKSGTTYVDVPCYCTPTEVTFSYDSTTEKVTVTPTDGPCTVTANTPSVSCEEVRITGTGVPGCDVTVDLSFKESGCSITPEKVTALSDGTWSAKIDVPCYCTPTKVHVYQGSSVSGSLVKTFENFGLDCEPNFTETFYCDAVVVKEDVTNGNSKLTDECPVTAKVYVKSDPEGYGFTPTCDGTYTAKLTASSPSATIDLSDLPCGCEPDYVEYSYGGVTFDDETAYAPTLNCICDDFTDVCKFEWYDDDRNEILFDTWLDCDGGKVKFTNPTYKDGGELVCFDFESTFPVFEVFVKGGGGKDTGNTYTWPCGTTDSDTAPSKSVGPNGNITWSGQLCANLHPHNGQQTAVSHVTFRVCKDETLDNKPANG